MSGNCQCSEEKDKYSAISNIIDLYRDKEGNLIQILHAAQEYYGYLSPELLEIIADRLQKPLSEITGVATFYSFFFHETARTPHYKGLSGTACYVRGGKKIIDALQKTLDVAVGDTTEDADSPLRWRAV